MSTACEDDAPTIGLLMDVLEQAGATQIAAMFASYDQASTVLATPTRERLWLSITPPACPAADEKGGA